MRQMKRMIITILSRCGTGLDKEFRIMNMPARLIIYKIIEVRRGIMNLPAGRQVMKFNLPFIFLSDVFPITTYSKVS